MVLVDCVENVVAGRAKITAARNAGEFENVTNIRLVVVLPLGTDIPRGSYSAAAPKHQSIKASIYSGFLSLHFFSFTKNRKDLVTLITNSPQNG